ncbi:MAG: hypothetical protein BWX83_01152 [Candidatus Cloacimonetes bacterium ADurb.Bin117]|nr:MAG: hypothetical protein BWX83_01152 [Candidatus Cloacimonetes bacterium ADurb.Bin117]
MLAGIDQVALQRRKVPDGQVGTGARITGRNLAVGIALMAVPVVGMDLGRKLPHAKLVADGVGKFLVEGVERMGGVAQGVGEGFGVGVRTLVGPANLAAGAVYHQVAGVPVLQSFISHRGSGKIITGMGNGDDYGFAALGTVDEKPPAIDKCARFVIIFRNRSVVVIIGGIGNLAQHDIGASGVCVIELHNLKRGGIGCEYGLCAIVILCHEEFRHVVPIDQVSGCGKAEIPKSVGLDVVRRVEVVIGAGYTLGNMGNPVVIGAGGLAAQQKSAERTALGDDCRGQCRQQTEPDCQNRFFHAFIPVRKLFFLSSKLLNRGEISQDFFFRLRPTLLSDIRPDCSR